MLTHVNIRHFLGGGEQIKNKIKYTIKPPSRCF